MCYLVYTDIITTAASAFDLCLTAPIFFSQLLEIKPCPLKVLDLLEPDFFQVG